MGEGRLYDMGVRAGALGLVLNSVVLGLMSLAIEHLARALGGVKRLWGLVNFLLAGCLGMTVLITKLAEAARSGAAGKGGETPPPAGIKVGALSLFAVLGIPQAVSLIRSLHVLLFFFLYEDYHLRCTASSWFLLM